MNQFNYSDLATLEWIVEDFYKVQCQARTTAESAELRRSADGRLRRAKQILKQIRTELDKHQD